jgi:hypothetical protein
MRRLLIALIVVCTLAAGGLFGWWWFAAHRSDVLVDEASVEIEAFNVSLTEAQNNFNLLFNDVNKQQFPQNRARWEHMAQKTAALYEKLAGHARAASGKLEEASRRPTKDVVVAYNRAQSIRLAKQAERCELLKEYTLLWVDPSLQTADALTTKQTEINHRLQPILAAEKASDDEATRIAGTNAHQFEQ